MKVLITNRFPEDVVRRISDLHEVSSHFEDAPMDRHQLSDRVASCHGLLCMIADTVDRSILEQAPDLKIVANYGVGYNNIDVKAASQRGILVTNTPGVLTNATADLAMALILAMGRRVVEGDRLVRQGRFRYWAPFHFLGCEISGKTLGIIGLGRIGRAVARRASGFEMPVVYYNRHRLDPDQEQALGVTYLPLEQLLAQADIVSLHVPLTPETHHLIGARELEGMKTGAYLINTARGPVVDEKALLAALQNKKIAGAGLDVYEDEPNLTPGLVDLDNVVLLPHVGSATFETRHRMAVMAVDNLLAGLAGQKPPNCVNPEILTKSR
jgi:glyoxylate reductase